MSGKQTGKVWELDLPHNQLWVLSALADNAHHDGSHCYPGDELLAWKTGYDVRTIKRLLKKLRETDYGSGPLIEVVGNHRGGRGHRVEYQLHLDRGPTKEPFEAGWTRRPGKGDRTPPIERVTPGSRKGDIPAPERVTPGSRKGDTHARACKNRPGSTRPGSVNEPTPPRAPARAHEPHQGAGEGGNGHVPVIEIPSGATPRTLDRLRRTAERTGARLIHEATTSTNGGHA